MSNPFRKLIFIGLMTLLSCKKEPGIGGNSSITGHVQVRHFNATYTQLLGIYPGADHYVYIVFGNHSGYDKRIKTDYAGNFEFDYLYPGDYTVYTYSQDSSGLVLSGQVVLQQAVDLGKKENQELKPFLVYE
jgi:hypothetical protein